MNDSGWLAYSDPTEVAPVNDLKRHISGEQCPCRPTWDGEVLVHNSFDGREAFERGERKMS